MREFRSPKIPNPPKFTLAEEGLNFRSEKSSSKALIFFPTEPENPEELLRAQNIDRDLLRWCWKWGWYNIIRAIVIGMEKDRYILVFYYWHSGSLAHSSRLLSSLFYTLCCYYYCNASFLCSACVSLLLLLAHLFTVTCFPHRLSSTASKNTRSVGSSM
jgi:hypothetical protein